MTHALRNLARLSSRQLLACGAVVLGALLFASAPALASEPVPNITGVAPEHGVPAGGTEVTITGSNFTGATGVHFGSNEAITFKVESDTKIVATTPPFSGGPEDGVGVYVTTPAGTNKSEECGHPVGYRYEPAITKVEPSSGPAAGGTHVTIRGAAFEGTKWGGGALCSLAIPVVQDVKFGSKEATHWNVESDTEITAVAPAGTGTTDVTIESVAGTSPLIPGDQFSYGLPVAPAIENVSATKITDETATLEAQINPENSETEYEVVIADPCGGPSDCILSSGKIPATAARESVRIELAGKELHLEPNTTYEYWIVAKHSYNEKTEVHETFTTLKTPSVDGESTSDITEHDAILEAKINSQGQGVYYQFQIDKNPSEFLPEMACPAEHSAELCLGSSVTAGALPIGFLSARSGDESVGLDLERELGVTLQPETTYHYRVIALSAPFTEDTITWKGPPAYGADQTFTTQGPKTTGLGGLTGSQTGSGTGNVVCPNNVASTGCAVADLTQAKPKGLTRAQKLAKALKQCRKYHKKSKRAKCKAAARKNYGPPIKRMHSKR